MIVRTKHLDHPSSQVICSPKLFELQTNRAKGMQGHRASALNRARLAIVACLSFQACYLAFMVSLPTDTVGNSMFQISGLMSV